MAIYIQVFRVYLDNKAICPNINPNATQGLVPSDDEEEEEEGQMTPVYFRDFAADNEDFESVFKGDLNSLYYANNYIRTILVNSWLNTPWTDLFTCSENKKLLGIDGVE